MGVTVSVATAAGSGLNWVRIGIEAGLLLTISVAAAGAILLTPGAMEWLTETLGLGWAVVGGYAALSLLLLTHWPAALARNWRWWLAGLVAAGGAVGGLSFVHGDSGPLYHYGLSGEWGYLLTNGSVGLAAVEAIIALAVIGLLVIPDGPRRYGLALRYAGSSVGRVLALAAAGVQVSAVGLVATAKSVKGARLPPSEGSPKASKSRAPKPPRPAAVTDDEQQPTIAPGRMAGNGWQLPAMDILEPAEEHSVDRTAIAKMSEEIKEALAEHGVYVEVEDVKAGPRVIRFGLVPGYVPQRQGKGEALKGRASRVRVGDIAKRQKDLALALKSPYIRIIETPEPGEGLVGLEVPNPAPGKVLMRSIMDESEFTRVAQKGGLPFALGQDAGGQSLALDLATMPHILIAGATGSGKSVCINSLIASLLMTRPPDQLRMIMVDPKRVELTPFNGIPHLVAPVIVEPDEVQPALRGLINEMSRRYRLMEEQSVRNIAGYNAKAAEPMPFLALIVDELADLMMTGGLEVEQQLVRLAQLGRAAGIHMVLATQRPSVKVVTGLLKANVPARVAFAVASQVDSRVILDSAGAETLMGKGDLLLQNNDYPKARRGQGTLVYDEEMDRLIEFWRSQSAAGRALPFINLNDDEEDADSGADAGSIGAESAPGGDHLDQARDIALRNPRLTSAMLERRFKIRKSEADEIIEDLKGEGLVIG